MKNIPDSNPALNSNSIIDYRGMKSDLLIPDLLEKCCRDWWNCPSCFPDFSHDFTVSGQTENEKAFEKITDEVIVKLNDFRKNQISRIGGNQSESDQWLGVISNMFQVDIEALAFFRSCGVLESIRNFVQLAHHFDPGLKWVDIYQAARNVMTANFVQLVLGLPVKLTPSIFAYSMLYPYTDNYLDAADITLEMKSGFNDRFYKRIIGETVVPLDERETRISELFDMIEKEWDRRLYPDVYESLKAIYSAQVKSLDLIGMDSSPFEKDILRVSMEKGGTSVLADGFLAAGSLTEEQVNLFFGFGSFTQLMDDFEDIELDRRDDRCSIFTVTSPYWKLDNLTNRFIHYGRTVLLPLNQYASPAIPYLLSIMDKVIDAYLIETIRTNRPYFNQSYIRRANGYSPFKPDCIRKQKRKFSRHKIGLDLLMQTFMLNIS